MKTPAKKSGMRNPQILFRSGFGLSCYSIFNFQGYTLNYTFININS